MILCLEVVLHANQPFEIITEHFPPYNIVENNEVKGISTDLVVELCKRVGHPRDFKIMEWSEAYNKTIKEPGTVLFSVTRSPKREKLFKWVGPLVPIKLVFLSKKSNALKINDINAARRVAKIGTYVDDYSEQYLQELGFKNLVSIKNNTENLQKLINDEIDLWIANEPTANYIAKKAGVLEQIQTAFVIQKEYMYLAFNNKTSNKTIEKWQAVFDNMQLDRSYDSILKKWAGIFDQSDAETLKIKKTIHISFVEGSDDAIAAKNVMKEAYRRIGHKVEFVPMNGQSSLDYSNSGKSGAELQRISGLKKYKNLIEVPIPINFIRGAVFSKEVNFPLHGWQSLKPYHIGIVEGIVFAKQGTRGMRVTVAKDYKSLLELLSKGEVDVAILPRVSGLLAINKFPDKEIVELNGVLELFMLYHYIHKKNIDLLPTLSRELKRMLINGTTRKIREDSYPSILKKD